MKCTNCENDAFVGTLCQECKIAKSEHSADVREMIVENTRYQSNEALMYERLNEIYGRNDDVRKLLSMAIDMGDTIDEQHLTFVLHTCLKWCGTIDEIIETTQYEINTD